MDAKNLYAQMADPSVKAPFVRDVAAVFAERLAPIAHKLTPEELASMIELGRIIERNMPVMVPVLRGDEIDDWLAGVTPARLQASPIAPQYPASGGATND